jgi:hypothetical protein
MLTKQTKDKDTERVKSQLKTYFRKVHQMVIQKKGLRNVGKTNQGRKHKEGEKLVKILIPRGELSNSPRKMG